MKVKGHIFALIILIVCITAVIFTHSTSLTTVQTINLPEVSLSFSVLGDVHEDTDKLPEVIKDLYKIRPNMDAMVLNGDAVDQGIQKQYDSMSKIINKNKSLLPDIIIKNIGNHEFFDYDNGINTPEDVKEFINRYLTFSGEKAVYHDKWIKGYHFISLGSENGNTKDFNAVKAYISPEQLKWFKEKLLEKYEAGKPIFVFLHQHIISGGKGWTGTDQAEEIRKILSDYPEAIIFTSHTHSSLSINNITLDQPFTMVHTGAVHYILKTDEKGGRVRTDDTQGIYVEVNGNKVTIKGRDFKSKSWIFSQEISK